MVARRKNRRFFVSIRFTGLSGTTNRNQLHGRTQSDLSIRHIIVFNSLRHTSTTSCLLHFPISAYWWLTIVIVMTFFFVDVLCKMHLEGCFVMVLQSLLLLLLSSSITSIVSSTTHFSAEFASRETLFLTPTSSRRNENILPGRLLRGRGLRRSIIIIVGNR